MMKILINSRPHQTRTACINGGDLSHFMVSDFRTLSPSGSIYMGKVVKIIPSLAACFVDIDLDGEAFLHIDEVLTSAKNIESALSEGQRVLVQIKTDAIGSKKPRLTMKISLVGRKLIYLPHSDGIGISRRIKDEGERERLEQCIADLKPKGGVIVRTLAEGESDFKTELQSLHKKWESIQKQSRKTPGLIQRDLPLELSLLRDELSSTYSQVLIDDKNIYEKALDYIESHAPELKSKITYYDGSEPLFEKFGIENKWPALLERVVQLKSGGTIVIDETEALTNIDINTARFVSKKSPQSTILKTNKEAVKEIARQIKLRNCGGMIIIDLIDMQSKADQEEILHLFEEELKKDPVYTEVISLSSLHLIQMTRKRVRESLKKTLLNPCPLCQKRGAVLSDYARACEIFREVESLYGDPAFNKKGAKKIQVECSASVTEWIHEKEMPSLEFLKKKYGIHLYFKEEPRAPSSGEAPAFHLQEIL